MAESSGESIRVEQREEQQEVFVTAIVRSRRQEQQVSGALANELTELEAECASDLVAVEPGRHLVCLVHDHQIPVGHGKLGLQLLAPRQLIKSSDEQVSFLERVARSCGLDHVAAQDVEAKVELVEQLLLPLLDQASWCDDEAAVEIATKHQLADVQPGHDRLARTRVVGEQEPQRLEWEQPAVDSFDLVGQRLDGGRTDGRERVEQVSELNATRFRGQLERCAVGVERPAPPCGDFDPPKILEREEPICDVPVITPIHHVQNGVPVRLDRHDGHVSGRDKSTHT